MNRFLALFCLAIAILVASYATPATADDYFFAVAARTRGANGTFFKTDTTFHNPTKTTMAVQVHYLPLSASHPSADVVVAEPGVEAHPEPPPLAFTLASGETRNFPDIVGNFSVTGDTAGGLLVRGEEGLVAVSRVFTLSSAVPGTFGQFVPARPASAAFVPGEVCHVIGLKQNADFRSNVGVLNTSSQSIKLTLNFFAADNTLLKTASWPPAADRLLASEWVQWSQVFSFFGISPQEVGRLEITTDAGSFFAYCSTVDNRAKSGDAVFIPGLHSSDAGTTMIVPAAAHSTGIFETNFQTDVFVFNAASEPAEILVEFLERDVNNSNPRRVTLSSFAPREVRALNDVVLGVFGLNAAAGALRFVASTEILVVSRTYDSRPDASFGQFIRGVEDSAAIAAGQVAVLANVEKSAEFRTNAGFVNMASASNTLTAALLSKTGVALGSKFVVLAPAESRQIDDIIGSTGGFGLSELKEGTLYVASESSLPFLAYRSTLDNLSDDSVFGEQIAASQSAGAGANILYFTADNSTFPESGGSTTLRWAVIGSTSVTLDGATAPAIGSRAVSINATTTFTLAAAGSTNDTATVTLTINALPNQPPTAVASVTPTTGTTATNFAFSGNGSFDPDGTVVTYAWNFGDGQNATGKNVVHVYAAAGTYAVTLTVTDDDGATDLATFGLTVSATPPVDVQIDIINFSFVPASKSVTVGAKVTWTNKDTTAHTATSTSSSAFASPLLDQNNTFSYTVQSSDVGTINYKCTPHPSMLGALIVTP